MPHSHGTDPTRRQLLAGVATGFTLPFLPNPRLQHATARPLRFGLIADLHHGLEPSAQARIEEFVAAAIDTRADAIVQLGDFNFGTAENEPCMKTWREFRGERYHVLGNHDMDKDTKAEIQEFWGMKRRHYFFEQNGWRFIVLDRNNLKKGDKYIPYGNANFYVDPSMRAWCDPEQLVWLDETLASSNLPVIIYTHQPIGHRPDSPQQRPILEIIKKRTTKNNRPKTRAVICGHQHEDWHLELDGVHHVCINSASYLWKDGKPWPYQDSLFTFMEINDGALTFTGMQTTWKQRPEGVENDPAISERDIELE